MKNEKTKLLARLANFNAINFILTLSGTRPVFDRISSKGRKFTLIGVIFVLINFGISLHVDYEHAQVQKYIYKIIMPPLMYAVTYLKRLADLLYPILIIIGSVVQFSCLDELSTKLDKIDSFFKKNNINTEVLDKKLFHFTMLAAVGTIIAMLISTVNLVYNAAYFTGVEFRHYYMGTAYYANFILTTLKVCKYLTGIGMRLDLFQQVLRRINLRHFDRNALPSYQPRWLSSTTK